MQFVVESEVDFKNTIKDIIDDNIFNKNVLYLALNIDHRDFIHNVPKKYPCIVSINFEEIEADNRRYATYNSKFIYIDELYTSKEYRNALKELDEADINLVKLYDERDTSGKGFPIDEIRELELKIKNLEKRLF